MNNIEQITNLTANGTANGKRSESSYNKKSMNLSQGITVLLAFPASFEHVDEDVVVPSLLLLQPSFTGFLGHKKKFLDPNSISFSSLPKPKQNKIK